VLHRACCRRLTRRQARCAPSRSWLGWRAHYMCHDLLVEVE
jgi:hypothetical protein